MYGKISELPQPVRKLLPVDAQEVFRKAANSAEDAGEDSNGAIRAGWGEVYKNWQRPASGIGKYVKKPGFMKEPTAGDVHVNTPLGGKKKKPVAERDSITVKSGERRFTITFDDEPIDKADEALAFDEMRCKIVKVDEAKQIVYGWASVITEKGIPVEDLQGDVIRPGELLKTTTDFMIEERVGKTNHAGDQTHMIVHSFPMTYELAKALGIETNDEGWLVGCYVSDPETLEKVISGDLPCFSIGGMGQRKEI